MMKTPANMRKISNCHHRCPDNFEEIAVYRQVKGRPQRNAVTQRAEDNVDNGFEKEYAGSGRCQPYGEATWFINFRLR